MRRFANSKSGQKKYIQIYFYLHNKYTHLLIVSGMKQKQKEKEQTNENSNERNEDKT